METTRHFTATVYVVHRGATALHEHERLGVLVPPGGPLDRDELPHEAGRREVRDELGDEPTLLDDTEPVHAPRGATLPRPRHQMLYDVNVHDGEVGHQHVDQIYYATVPTREIENVEGEAPADAWGWYDPTLLRTSEAPADVTELGIEAIRTAATAAE